MSHQNDLIKKFESRDARVGVVGLGYVGVPLRIAFANAGYHVTGFDISAQKVDVMNAGESCIHHIPGDAVGTHVKSGRLRATLDFSKVGEMHAVILCVPTPLSSHQEPDLTAVISSIDCIAPHLHRGMLISLESTTYPGTTEEEVVPRVEKAGLEVGRDVFVTYSPEREDPGNKHFSTGTIPKVIGGITTQCRSVGAALYGSAVQTLVHVSSTRAAELTKLLENIYRSVNIGLVNEMKILCDRMGIDIWEVIDAAKTKPFGFTAFYPGPGLGGHCLPIDPFYLTWKAKEFGLHTRFIEIAGEVNRAMPLWVVGKITDGLNARMLPLRGSKILILGLAYKKNIEDVRESPSLELMERLAEKGAVISFSDPFVLQIRFPPHSGQMMSSVPLTADALSQQDCVVIATDHDAFDYQLIREKSKMIVDTRGRIREPLGNVIRA